MKPYLNYYDKHVHLKLPEKIENKESIHALEEYVEATEYMSTYQYERAQLTFDSLLGIKDELVPIESHEDFRVALEKAYQRYECRKIAEHLPLNL
ncbi:hypothetical protein [Chryseobacterium indoltheticum]|uniref:hypothetical protein n=1 Tax=Chryseobacterium indoltheticum TaxID=254 RepID=UPI003F494501